MTYEYTRAARTMSVRVYEGSEHNVSIWEGHKKNTKQKDKTILFELLRKYVVTHIYSKTGNIGYVS